MKITINGKTIEAQPEASVLEAALGAGIYIPNLCYHPDLPPIGACRLCIVEIEGMKGFPASCATKVKEAMVIKTDSERIQKLRKYILWLMLSEHPKDLTESSQFREVLDWIGLDDTLPHSSPRRKNIPPVLDEP